MIKLKDLITENDNQIIQTVQQSLIDYYGSNTWKDFVDRQSLGECQNTINFISQQFPQFRKVVGEIETDEPYVDEEGEQQTLMLHHWVTLHGKPYEFSKGTLKEYIHFDNLYDVEVEDSARYHVGK